MTENYFSQLYSINVKEHIEKKNGLSYLSWVWAWAEIKKRHPDASYTIYENKDGLNYHTDGNTCWVKTGVTVCGIEHIEYLPVMDHRNRSIPLAAVTSVDVNRSIQRSLTKACARHGLGLYVYAGEDLPEKAEDDAKSEDPTMDQPAPEEYIFALHSLIESTNSDPQKIRSFYGVTEFSQLTKRQAAEAVAHLNKKSRGTKK